MIVQTYVEMDIVIAGVSATYRFTFPQNEIGFDSIPALQSVAITPQVLDPGNSMGMRASVRIAMRDFQFPLLGSSYSSGTFFGKLRARRRSLQGFPLRLIRGEQGQSLGDMITEHFVIESVTRSGEAVTVIAKDVLKLADGDRSQAPAVSRGRLLNALSEVDASLTLNPAGIGDLDYPASGKVSIGGSEVCSYTRVADVMTLTRAQSGTDASTHDVDELVQWVLVYDGESPADIIYDLLTTYTDVDAAWCNVAAWRDDIDTYVARLYSAEITEPTSVRDLINEIVAQVGLVMYWDAIAQQIRLSTLRPMVASRTITTDEIIHDSFMANEQPEKRASEVWTYFGLHDSLADIDKPNSFRSVLVTVDASSQSEYETAAIRKVFSRWIALNNRPAASRLNAMLLARYRDPPRKFMFLLSRHSVEPELGAVATITHWALQDANGNAATALMQFTSIEKTEDTYKCTAEETVFGAAPGETIDEGDIDGVDRLVYIDASVYNINLRTLHDSLYAAAASGDEITCVIAAAAFVGSLSVSLPAFTVGDWPAGVVLKLIINGRIQGKGGDGGVKSLDFFAARSAQAGGTALFARFPITIENNGKIYGGGGGGGAGDNTTGSGLSVEFEYFDGGGGAGNAPGGPNGTTEAGGPPSTVVGTFGFGGGPGQPGNAGKQAGILSPPPAAPGGAAGLAVDGDSFVTFSPLGIIAGARVN